MSAGERADAKKRFGGLSSMPVLASVAALAALAVVMTQAVAFLVVLLAPEPRPAGFSLRAAADALSGRPARTGDGRELIRRMSDPPIVTPEDQLTDPLALAVQTGLAQQLGVAPPNVRVRIERRRPPGPFRGPPLRFADHPPRQPGVISRGATNFVIVRRSDGAQTGVWRSSQGEPSPEGPVRPSPSNARGVVAASPNPSPSAVQGSEPTPRGALRIDTTTRQFTILADRLTFDPFAASVQLRDGRWATIEPPRDLIAPWQMRILLSMLVSMLVLAPVVWLLAQRITRPIRAFAEAAERLGADPDAEPLTARGPTEVRTAIAAFNEMQDSIRSHIRKRTQTVAAIAHDLRTPLTRLRFRAEQAPEALRDRMAGDIEEMDALIAQAMAYVRGETPPERLEPLDLNALAKACAAGFAETGGDVSFKGRTRLNVIGDAAGLKRAVANLIDNAVKFGGAARVSTGIVGGMATVTVEDDGPGLDAAELEAVLEPFVRGEQSRNRETGGAGLGLAVARQAARASGGDLVLSNRPEGGLRARLSLPLSC